MEMVRQFAKDLFERTMSQLPPTVSRYTGRLLPIAAGGLLVGLIWEARK